MSLLGSSSLLLSGCGGLFGGGSGGSNGGSLKKINVSLILPPGINASDLVITSSGGNAPLASTSATIQVSDTAPSLVMVIVAATYKVVLMGFADPSANAMTLDASSTAVALMALGLGGAGLSGQDRKTLLGDIGSSPEAATLSAAIQTAHSINSFALTDGDSSLKAAVKSAVQSFSSSWSGGRSPSVSSSAYASALDPLLLIEPSNEVEGLTVVQTDNKLGFQVQNRRRRTGVAYTYLVGHTSSTDVDSDENPPKQVGQPLYIPSTKNLLSLPYGWAQVASNPVALSLAGDDRKTKFETILLSTSFGGQVPAIYSDPRFSPFVQTWKDEAARLRQASILQGIAELVLEVIGLGGTLFEYASLTALIPQAIQTTAIGSGLTAAASGNIFYEFVLQELLETFTAEALFALELPIIQPLIAQVNAARAAELFAGQTAANSMALARAGLVVLVVLGIIELVDIAAVAHDTRGGQEANTWALTAFKPTVQLTPKDGQYVPGNSFAISASAPGVGAQGVTYQWSLSGSSLANLSDGSQVGSSFTSTSPVVNLATTPSTQGNLTVSVTVKKNGVTVGSATAVYEPGSGLEIEIVEITFGPRYQYPSGGGYQIAYVAVPLQGATRTLTKLSGTNNASGYDGAKASMFVKMPPKSTPVYPINQEIVSGQNMSLTQLVNEGNAYGLNYTNSSWTPDQAFRLVNYGDKVLVWLALSDWNNAASPESGLPYNSATALARVEQALTQRTYNISIVG